MGMAAEGVGGGDTSLAVERFQNQSEVVLVNVLTRLNSAPQNGKAHTRDSCLNNSLSRTLNKRQKLWEQVKTDH